MPQLGCIHDDTEIFIHASHLAQQGERTEVVYLTYELNDDTFILMSDRLREWYNTKQVFKYTFPDGNGQFAEGCYNCATFPRLLGIQLPVDDGRLAYYVKVMEEKGALLWRPPTS